MIARNEILEGKEMREVKEALENGVLTNIIDDAKKREVLKKPGTHLNSTL